MDDLVLRSAYLRLSDDMLLRKLAHDLNVTKSDLIRAAIHVKLEDWRSANDPDAVLRDLAFRVGDAEIAASAVVKVLKTRQVQTKPPLAKEQRKVQAKPAALQSANRKISERSGEMIPA